eukprot:Em0003g966a
MSGKVEFVDEIPQELICSICLKPAEDPEQTRCTCSKLYCSICIQYLKQTSDKCPTCRKDLEAFPDGLSARRLRSLRVKCSYNGAGCLWVNEWAALKDHIKTCPKVQIDCPYTKVGCTFVCPREHMPIHGKVAIQDHLDKAITALQLSPKFVVRLPEFSKKKEANKIWPSPGFYTHPNGFKVYLRVYPNGHSDRAGTHLSVFMKLMSGDNDDNLVWPLRATFTVTLLNQIRDKNHKSEVFTIDEKLNWCKISGNSTGPPGHGNKMFATFSELNLNEAKQCQYLKDDTLYFRVVSDVYSQLLKENMTSYDESKSHITHSQLPFCTNVINFPGSMKREVEPLGCRGDYHPDTHGSQPDLGLVPGGKVKLIKNVP